VSFDHPLSLLFLLLLPALWVWMRATPGASRACMALKCAVFATLVIALSGPSARLHVNKLAVTLVMDTSASMPRQSLEQGEAMLRDLVRKKSGADLRLITFAGNPQLQPLPANAQQVTIPKGLDANEGMATDMEGALQLALNTLPTQGARRVLLISDGNETQGNALSEALRARERGVSIFTVPSGGTAPLPVTADSMESPENVFSGEHFTLSLHLDSARPLPVRVWATAQGVEIGAAMLDLQAGGNVVSLNVRIVESGVMLVEVHISSSGAEQILFSQAITVARPRVLYISGDSKGSAPLLQMLKTAGVDVQTASAFPLGVVKQGWDAVLLDNYPNQPLSSDEDAALADYVYRGGGLIFIAGDKNAQLARDPMTPFEKMLPVRSLPPPQKPAAVILVLDRSGSMAGRPIALVRYATKDSILGLRPVDKVGVISFNEAFNWDIPMGPASDLPNKSDKIDQIKADGDTDIYQPMLAAFTAILRENASSRHIILITDGDQTKNTFMDFPKLEQDATAQHVIITTIGVGYGVNHPLLDDLAHKTGGKSFYVEDTGVPQILNAEMRSVDDMAIQEKSARVVRVRPAEFTDGIDFTKAPALLGFVQSEAKDGAETILRVDHDKALLVRWNYGLGSVIAFMSDAKGRWAAPWVQWKSFGTLWPQMVRAVSSHRDQTVRAGVRQGSREGETIVYYDTQGQTGVDESGNENGDQSTPAPDLANEPQLVVRAPDGTSSMVALEKTAPDHYEARFTAGERGLYRVVSSSDGGNSREGNSEVALPQVGFYHNAEEMKPQAVNLALLSEISRVTGGRVDPSMDQLLSDRGSLLKERRPLWPYLLLLALALNLMEVAVRKGFLRRLQHGLSSQARAGLLGH
jgi:Ca-activated chloride channel family protein